MKRLSAKAHIAMGQSFLIVSLMLSAVFFGLVPDRIGAQRDGRAALAETIAVNSSALINDEDTEKLKITLGLLVERNDEILSVAVRRAGGESVVTLGDHDRHWHREGDEQSTDSQVTVPIWGADAQWGQVELRYRPLVTPGWLGWVQNPAVLLTAFVGIAGFVMFYFYLGKVLRHLDPKQAIPPHVRSALDTLAEGLMVLDLKGEIVLANRAFAEVMGEEADAMLGRQSGELGWASPDGSPITPEVLPWAKALLEGSPHRSDVIHLRNRHGKLCSFLVNCSPVLGGGGKHAGVLVSLDDITVLEEHKDELRQSKEEAEAANRSKSDFLANMSHEIRTPMNAILGFTEVLKRGYAKSEAESRKHLNTIHSSGKHLLELINDVLDLSKVEAGRLDVELIDFAPHHVVRDVAKVLAVKAEEKGISLNVLVQGLVPETIRSDPTRLRQIVTNLVGNAIKFTSEGGVDLVLRLDSAAASPHLVLEIVDSGVGMPADKVESVFDPFVQADSSVTRQFGGTGLGLAISRRFARALGGDVVATSELGKGSTFTVTLDPGPLEGVRMIDADEALSAAGETDEDEAKHWVFPPTRVLVVDDGEENRDLLAIVLGDVGLEVEGAENGQVGVDMVEAGTFDVVLMDMQMPIMDGKTATRTLRERGCELPIIALTANAMKGYEQELIEAGCTGYLTKPIDVDHLLATLAELLGGKAEKAEPQPPSTLPEPTPSAPPSAAERLAPVVSRLAGSTPRAQAIIGKFAARLSAQLGELDRAWEARNFETIAAFAHWLKGSGGTVGFEAFTEPAETLEMHAKQGSEEATAAAIAEVRGIAGRLVIPGAPSAPASAPAACVASPETPSAASTAPTEASPPAPASPAAENPRMQRIRERFIERLGGKLDELDCAWQLRDFEAIAQFGHWLKGSGGTVGLHTFTEPAQNLEALAKTERGEEIEAAINVLRDLARTLVAPPRAAPVETVDAEEPDARPRSPATAMGSAGAPPSPRAAAGATPSAGGAASPRMQAIREKFTQRLEARLDELEDAWARRDFQHLAAFGHWLKGSGGTVGFHEFTEPAAELEQLARAGDEGPLADAVAAVLRIAGRTDLPALKKA